MTLMSSTIHSFRATNIGNVIGNFHDFLRIFTILVYLKENHENSRKLWICKWGHITSLNKEIGRIIDVQWHIRRSYQRATFVAISITLVVELLRTEYLLDLILLSIKKATITTITDKSKICYFICFYMCFAINTPLTSDCRLFKLFLLITDEPECNCNVTMTSNCTS